MCPCETTETDCMVHVGCDRQCLALEDPRTPEEWQTAAVHWKEHGWMHGCSHAC